MITYTLENASVTLRNSGTEPKLKYYIDTRSESSMEDVCISFVFFLASWLTALPPSFLFA